MSKSKIIEFKGKNSDLVYQIDFDVNAPVDTEVIVPPTHNVFFILDGKMSEPLEIGIHRLYEIKKRFFFSKEKVVRNYSVAKIIYISKTAKIEILWGTTISQQINYIDPELGYPTKLGAYGKFEAKIKDYEKFYLEIVANDTYEKEDENGEKNKKDSSNGKYYDVSTFQKRIRAKSLSIICNKIKEKLLQEKLSYYAIEDHKLEMQNNLIVQLNDIFVLDYGFEVCDFIIESVTMINEEDENKLREIYEEKHRRTGEIQRYREDREFELEKRKDQEDDYKHELNIKKENLTTENEILDSQLERQRESEEYERKKRHEDEDRAWSREDKNREEDRLLKEKEYLYDAIKSAGWENAPRDDSTTHSNYCRKCGSGYSIDDLYCPNCGAPTDNNKNTIICSSCNAEISVKYAFCPRCGKKIERN